MHPHLAHEIPRLTEIEQSYTISKLCDSSGMQFNSQGHGSSPFTSQPLPLNHHCTKRSTGQNKLCHTSLVVAECPSQGAAQPHFSILQVFQQQVLHRYRLPVQLVAELLIVGDGSSDYQHFLEQENVQFLEENNPQDVPKQQSSE